MEIVWSIIQIIGDKRSHSGDLADFRFCYTRAVSLNFSHGRGNYPLPAFSHHVQSYTPLCCGSLKQGELEPQYAKEWNEFVILIPPNPLNTNAFARFVYSVIFILSKNKERGNFILFGIVPIHSLFLFLIFSVRKQIAPRADLGQRVVFR
ncbi:Uncharacterised protein [Listeria newyorkensis]|nr:Uncharacterised protein [Listeria newyorkensis]